MTTIIERLQAAVFNTRGARRFMLPSLTGAIAGVSTSLDIGGPFVPLLFVYPCVFTWLVAASTRVRSAFVDGAVAGFIANMILFYWVTPLLVDFGQMSFALALLLAVLLSAAQGLALAFAACIARYLAQGTKGLALATGASMTVVFSIFPSVFPWTPSIPLVTWNSFAQVAELGGAPLLDALCFFSGAFFAEAALGSRAQTPARSESTPSDAARSAANNVSNSASNTASGSASNTNKRRHMLLCVSVGMALVVLPALGGMALGARAQARYENAELLRVGVVQSNISIEDKHNDAMARQNLAKLRRITGDLVDRGAELVLWPETMFPFAVPRTAHNFGSQDAALIAGALTTGDSRCERFNSAVYVAADRHVLAIRDKIIRMPFSEAIPFHEYLTPIHDTFPCPGIQQGEVLEAPEIAGARVATLNCYEDVMPSASTWYPRAELLVNITNDAWFGDTSEPHLHQMAARLRAIETRAELVRSVNTGVSSHIDALGREVWTTEVFTEAAPIAEVHLFDELTWFERYGDALGWLLRLLVAAALVFRFVQRRRAQKSVSSSDKKRASD